MQVFFNRLLSYVDLWWRVARAPFLTASLGPVLLGNAIAYHATGQIDWLIFTLTVVGALCGHLGANIINDYYDHLSGADDRNTAYTPFSGGSRMIQAGIISANKVRHAAWVCFSITIICGIVLFVYSQLWGLIGFGLAGIGLGMVYSSFPWKLSYRGWGELAVALAFGPVIILGTFYAQTAAWSGMALVTSIPVGLLVGLILYINEIQDEESDRRTGKYTLVVIINDTQRALQVYRRVLFFTFLWMLGFSLTGIIPVWNIAVIILWPLGWRLWKLTKQPYQQVNELLPVNAGTIGLQFLTTLILAAGFLIK